LLESKRHENSEGKRKARRGKGIESHLPNRESNQANDSCDAPENPTWTKKERRRGQTPKRSQRWKDFFKSINRGGKGKGRRF